MERSGNHTLTIYMIGNYKYSIDEKSRIIIPPKFRIELGGKVVVSLGFDQSIEVRKIEDFKLWQEKIISEGSFSKKARILQRAILGNSYDLNIDKQGRILLPQQLLKDAKIKSDVQIIGMGNKLEILSQKKWLDFMKETGNGILEKAAEDLSD